MKEIRLSNGMHTQVDDIFYPMLMQYKWHARKGCNTYYAQRSSTGKNRKTISLHRLILGLVDTNIEVDHKDGNGLNNQLSNLRTCTNSQNQYNKQGWSSCGYKGVTVEKFKRSIRIRAYIGDTKNRIYLGRFKTIEEAALAYNKAAIEHYGEFAKLNIIKT